MLFILTTVSRTAPSVITNVRDARGPTIRVVYTDCRDTPVMIRVEEIVDLIASSYTLFTVVELDKK